MRYFREVILAVSLLSCFWGLRVAAQGTPEPQVLIERNSQRVTDVDRRLSSLENSRLVERMAVLESTMELNKMLLVSILLGLTGLLLEAGFRMLRVKKTSP